MESIQSSGMRQLRMVEQVTVAGLHVAQVGGGDMPGVTLVVGGLQARGQAALPRAHQPLMYGNGGGLAAFQQLEACLAQRGR